MEPLHFAVEQNTVNDKADGGREGGDCASQINRFADGKIDPDAPEADANGEKSGKDDENNMEAFDRH
jgi:hypothetical protein